MTKMGRLREVTPTRFDLDAAISQDDHILDAILVLLSDTVPLCNWPPHLVSALAGSIAPNAFDPTEAEKARRLKRQLFVDMPPPLFSTSGETPGRWSDRLRADLADLVTFGAGLYLVDYDAFVRR